MKPKPRKKKCYGVFTRGGRLIVAYPGWASALAHVTLRKQPLTVKEVMVSW